jgi:hypothetical protein
MKRHRPLIWHSRMQPQYGDYCWMVEQIAAGVPMVRLRQDLVYELFRLGILEVDPENRLRLSDLGRSVCKAIEAGEHAPELD